MPIVPSNPDRSVKTGMSGILRRSMLAAPPVLGRANAACAQEGDVKGMKNSKILVAYVTHSGNTRVIAGTLQRALGPDLSRSGQYVLARRL